MRESYICILDWMVKELKLSGNELLVFAIIHGFSQDGECAFVGSKQYICDRLNISRQTSINCINALIEKGFIEESEELVNGFVRKKYKVCLKILHPVKKLEGVVKKIDTPCQKNRHNNKEENKDIININKEKFRKESVSFREQDLEKDLDKGKDIEVKEQEQEQAPKPVCPKPSQTTAKPKESEKVVSDAFAIAIAKRESYQKQITKWLEEIQDEEWRRVMAKWLEYKYREKNERYKEVGFRRICTHLYTIANGNVYLADAIVQESMVNNYRGLFPPRKELLERFNNSNNN